MANGKLITIPCRVSQGMFSTERQVVVALPNGQEIDALVDHRSVIVSGKLEAGKSVPGRVSVSVVYWDKKAKTALVDLPQGSFSKGPRIQVSSQMIAKG